MVTVLLHTAELGGRSSPWSVGNGCFPFSKHITGLRMGLMSLQSLSQQCLLPSPVLVMQDVIKLTSHCVLLSPLFFGLIKAYGAVKGHLWQRL